MTVCLAAICDYTRVIGVSDRMITSGDIEFEPPQRKVWNLAPSIFVLTAGDTTLQAEIMRDVDIDVSQRIIVEPANVWRVRDVAELYRGYYEEIRQNRAESAILKPLGLDTDSFVAHQADIDSALVERLVTDLTNYTLPNTVQSLFIGVDNDGPVQKNGAPGLFPHIYVSNDGRITCYDTTGFAAIGYGDWHAQSQLMFAKHWRGRPLAETLLLTYSAKKHAEVAPGVGSHTDMLIAGPGLDNSVLVGDHVLKEFERIYSETRDGIDELNRKAERAFRTFTAEINKQPTSKESRRKLK